MSEPKRDEMELAQELRELGRQLQQMVRVAREHPQTREVEHRVAQAVGELSQQIDRALHTAREDERIKQAGSQVKQTTDAFKESHAAEDIQRGLAKGLRVLNEQIARAIAEAEKPSSTPPSAPPPPPPVEK